jgi:hypothetical protein
LDLAGQQFLQPRLVLEGPLGLGLIVGESFVEPLQLLLFFRGGTIEGAQRVLDALHGADRIAGVDARAVGSRASDEKVRLGRGWLTAAQDFEALEGGVLGQRVIVAG